MTAKTLTTSDRIRAVAHAMNEAERRKRFYALVEIAAETGGILLDPDMTELVILGSLLGIHVEWERVELPVFGKQMEVHKRATGAQDKKGKARQWETTAQAEPAAQSGIFDGT